MGSGKQGISDEYHDRQEEVKLEDNAVAGAARATSPGKRSYECTFCKRGFTNAQALGGHMNIHRKDRAKTKQLTPGSSSSSVSFKPNMNPNFMGRVSSGQHMNYYPVFETQSHFQMQNFSHGNSENGLVRRQGNNQSSEHLWGENLSLRVRLNHNVEDELGEVPKEDELDLELRLGHDHRN